MHVIYVKYLHVLDVSGLTFYEISQCLMHKKGAMFKLSVSRYLILMIHSYTQNTYWVARMQLFVIAEVNALHSFAYSRWADNGPRVSHKQNKYNQEVRYTTEMALPFSRVKVDSTDFERCLPIYRGIAFRAHYWKHKSSVKNTAKRYRHVATLSFIDDLPSEIRTYPRRQTNVESIVRLL